MGTAGAVGKGAGGVGGANTETAGQINNDNAVSPFTTMYARPAAPTSISPPPSPVQAQFKQFSNDSSLVAQVSWVFFL